MGTYRIIRVMLIRKPLIIVVVSAVIVFIVLYLRRDFAVDILDRESVLTKMDEAIKNSANTRKCKHPNLPVYSPEMMKFVKLVPPIECYGYVDWVICEDTECRIKPEIINIKGPIHCSFTDIMRKNEYIYFNGETTYTDSYYKLERSDTVHVSCKSEMETWESILTAIRYDHTIWDRVGWDQVPENSMKLNVLMFALDSLSHNTVIRKLPNTYKYLMDELDPMILNGYNIIGDGTPQALTPILTGKIELELPETRRRVKGAQSVDVYPFIWKDFRNSGYVTGYLEDCPTFGTYTYRLNGFNNPPTDHYMRTYYMKIEEFKKKWKHLCAGEIPRHQVMLNHIKSFFRVYKDKPKFMFGFHAELSHDDYNLIGAADDDIMNFFKYLNEAGFLNNTIVIFMADHGHRFASIRNTLQGKMEERLPFFSFIFPPWFKHKFPTHYNNFKDNLETLVTPFDIYSTLKTILQADNIKSFDHTERSQSIFSNIPKDRNCATAYIEPHWCSCLEWNAIKLSEPIVQQLSDAFANHLNHYTKKYRDKCALLKISSIYWVHKLSPNENLLKFKKNYDVDGFVPDLTGKTTVNYQVYQIKVMMTPGESLFEATISHNLKTNLMEIQMDDISRINMYGDQARCVEADLPQLRKYCFCTTD